MKINCVKASIDAALPLAPVRTATGSALALEVCGVPARIGGETVTAVTAKISNADLTTITQSLTKDAGGVWCGVVAASNFATYGHVANGFKLLVTLGSAASAPQTLAMGDLDIYASTSTAEPGDPQAYVPEGGTAGQVLTKRSAEDYDTEWAAGGSTDANAVHYTADSGKTASAKAVARTNIGASAVSVSATGTATDEVQYITVDGVEKKLAGGGGTGDYDDLTNRPQIAGVTLTGNKTAADLSLATAAAVAAKQDALTAGTGISIASNVISCTVAGVASGGTAGQVLKKKSATDYDTEWGAAGATYTAGTGVAISASNVISVPVVGATTDISDGKYALCGATASNSGTVAIGGQAETSGGIGATALGLLAKAQGEAAIALGYNARATHYNSTTLGNCTSNGQSTFNVAQPVTGWYANGTAVASTAISGAGADTQLPTTKAVVDYVASAVASAIAARCASLDPTTSTIADIINALKGN